MITVGAEGIEMRIDGIFVGHILWWNSGDQPPPGAPAWPGAPAAVRRGGAA